jgi:hypothetical protein
MSLQHKMHLQNHALAIHGTVSYCLDVPSGWLNSLDFSLSFRFLTVGGVGYRLALAL